MLREYLTRIADAIRSALGVTSGTTYYVANYEYDEENDLNIFTKTDEVVEHTEEDIEALADIGENTTTGEKVYLYLDDNNIESFCCAVSSDGTINAQDFPDKIAEVYEKGKSEGGGTDYLQYVRSISFFNRNVFEKAEVEINLGENLTSLAGLLSITEESNMNNTLEHITINSSGLPTDISTAFNCTYAYRDSVLKKITLNVSTKNALKISNLFACNVALEEIDGVPLDFSSAATNQSYNVFNYCNALKEVRFAKNSIPISISFAYAPSISDETIQSIIDGLADLTGGTAQTLTVHATVGAKITDEQKATISAKNWTLVY